MRLNRTLRAGFAVVFALLLPLQGSAAIPHCAASTAAQPAGSPAGSPAALDHCAHASAAIHNHDGCGKCRCGTAIALTPVLWIAPLLSAPEIYLAAFASSPRVTLDRLDRPPRLPG
jgi:hypothetical protein